MRAVVPRLELRATAFVRSSRPTIWNTSVCLAGASSASATPWTKPRTYSCHAAMTPVSARTQSTAACSASTDSTTTIIRRRSTRSAIEPPTSASAVTGRVCTSASAPTATGEPVSSRTSQYAAICCIHVPMNEMPLPAK